MVLTAVSLYAGFAVLLLVLTLLGYDSLRVLMPLLFTSFAFLGTVIPSTMVLALERHGPIAGIAAALGGTLQMVTGGAMIAVAGLFFNGTTLPMVATIAVAAVGALLVSTATLRHAEPVAAAAE